MMPPLRRSLVIAFAILSGSVACSSDDSSDTDDTGGSTSDAATNDSGASSDSGGADATNPGSDGSAKNTTYCAENTTAVFCDDFTDAAKTASQWTTKTDSTSTATSGSSSPVLYKSNPTLHVHMGSAAGALATLTGTLPSTMNVLYGRMRMYVAPLGTASGWPQQHTTFFSAIAANGAFIMAEQFQQISSLSSPETGGVHYEYPGCEGDAASCSSAPWPSGQWLCLEWLYDDKNTDIYDNGRGGTAQNYWLYLDTSTPAKSVMLTDQYGSETQFPIPNGYTSIALGGSLFGDSSSQGAAFDFYFTNFAVGPTRFDDCASDE